MMFSPAFFSPPFFRVSAPCSVLTHTLVCIYKPERPTFPTSMRAAALLPSKDTALLSQLPYIYILICSQSINHSGIYFFGAEKCQIHLRCYYQNCEMSLQTSRVSCPLHQSAVADQFVYICLLLVVDEFLNAHFSAIQKKIFNGEITQS